MRCHCQNQNCYLEATAGSYLDGYVTLPSEVQKRPQCLTLIRRNKQLNLHYIPLNRIYHQSSHHFILTIMERTRTQQAIFLGARQPFGGLGRLIFRGFTITLRHTTLGRTPLDEGPARGKDLYLTTHNTHNRQTTIP
jgi:hypothetical protein